MSGYPTGLDAPGKDYKLRGNEIVTVPNRTGGGMNVREALEKKLQDCAMLNPRRDAADELAPIIEKGLRAAAVRMGNRAGFYWAGHKGLLDECVAAGVAAMAEES